MLIAKYTHSDDLYRPRVRKKTKITVDIILF